MLTLILNLLSFVITVAGFLINLKQKEQTKVVLEKHIHVHSHVKIPEKTPSAHKSGSNKERSSEELVATAFATIIFAFVYIRFGVILETILAIISIFLTLIITILSYRYLQDTKEDLRNYFIISQSLLFEITSIIYIYVLNVDFTAIPFINAATWKEFIGLTIVHFLEPKTTIVIFYSAFSTAFYVFQICALLGLFARIAVIYLGLNNTYFHKIAINNFVFAPNIATAFMLIFSVFFKLVYQT